MSKNKILNGKNCTNKNLKIAENGVAAVFVDGPVQLCLLARGLAQTLLRRRLLPFLLRLCRLSAGGLLALWRTEHRENKVFGIFGTGSRLRC
jgi:hypothetical protein